MTVRVGGEAGRWATVPRFWFAIGEDEGAFYRAERARAYRDRLVLKLSGVDDANAAARFRGAQVSVAIEDAPELEHGERYVALLIGLDVVDEQGRRLGAVEGVGLTGGTDLLQVRRPGTEGDDGVLLVPMASEIVLEIDEANGRITVRLPPGLAELNR